MRRCQLCGVTDYPASLGGPNICPLCDCGNFHDPGLAMKRMLGLKSPALTDERQAVPWALLLDVIPSVDCEPPRSLEDHLEVL